MRVQSAEVRLPRSYPVTLKAELLQWPGGFPTDLDDVDGLFSQTEPSEAPIAPRVEPSPLLRSLLGAMPASIRQRFRPGTEVEEPTDPKRFLLPLRQLWSRHRANQAIADPSEECSAANSSLLQSLADAENCSAIDSDGHSLAYLSRNAQSRYETYGDGMIHQRLLLGIVSLRRRVAE